MSTSVQLYSVPVYSQKKIPSIYNLWIFVSETLFQHIYYVDLQHYISKHFFVSYKSDSTGLIQFFFQIEVLKNKQNKYYLFLSVIHLSIHPNTYFTYNTVSTILVTEGYSSERIDKNPALVVVIFRWGRWKKYKK